MNKTNKNNNSLILYGIAGLALLLSIASIAGLFTKQETDFDWRCSFAECTEYVEITGQEWAQENCAITEEGTICLATFDDGRQFQVPLEELNLTEITATKCLEYICTEEQLFRQTNYKIDITT